MGGKDWGVGTALEVGCAGAEVCGSRTGWSIRTDGLADDDSAGDCATVERSGCADRDGSGEVICAATVAAMNEMTTAAKN